MELETRVETWLGNQIRFVKLNGEWYAVLVDVCRAVGLGRTDHVSEATPPEWLEKVVLSAENDGCGPRNSGVTHLCEVGNSHSTSLSWANGVCEPCNSGATSDSKARKTQTYLVINEPGIYQMLMRSRKLEARKFAMWTAQVLVKLRQAIGLEAYQAFELTDPEKQEEIDWILDSLYYDPETGKLMRSVTVAGGDVEQVPFDE